MPRPGQLTRGRANRTVKTPGGRLVVHRQKFYSAGATCGGTGVKMQLKHRAKHRLSRKASKSAKRPNRPYGGKITARAVKRGLIRQIRRESTVE